MVEQERRDECGDNQEVPPHGNNIHRPIGAFDEPIHRKVSLGILPPPIPNNNFELKPSMLDMVERSTFKGNPIECPLEHLYKFERLCRTIKKNGVPEDTIKMMLFPYSLEDKGEYWEMNTPSHLVATWDSVKTEFLRKFFPKQKTIKLRHEIRSFRQKGEESLSEAWDRLKDLTRSCPHHGVSKENLLGIFYRGVHKEIRRALDTASFGSFASLNCKQAETLIENFAQSDTCFEDDYERSSRANDGLKKVNDKLDLFIKLLGESQGGHQENGYNKLVVRPLGVSHISSQGGYNNNNESFDQNPPNLSYRSTNVEDSQYQVYNQSNTQSQAFQDLNQQVSSLTPNFQQGFQPQGSTFNQASQDFDVRAMFELIMDGQANGQKETDRKLMEMNARIDQVTSYVKTLDSQVAQLVSSSQKTIGFSPGKAEMNLKAHSNVTLPRSEDEDLVKQKLKDKEQLEENEKALEEIARLLESSHDGKIVNKGEELVEGSTKKTPYEPSPYEPKVPFPRRVYTKKEKSIFSQFKKDLGHLGITLPMDERLDQVPTQVKFIKAILANKEKVEEMMQPSGAPKASTLVPKILSKKEPPKVEVATTLVEDVLGKKEKLEHESPLIKVAKLQKVEEKLMDVVPIVKSAKTPMKKKKLEKAKCESHGSKPPSLTSTPLKFIDEELECKVTSKERSKPYFTAKVILEPISKEIASGVIKKTMGNDFGRKLGDRGPHLQDGSPSPFA